MALDQWQSHGFDMMRDRHKRELLRELADIEEYVGYVKRSLDKGHDATSDCRRIAAAAASAYVRAQALDTVRELRDVANAELQDPPAAEAS